MRVIVRVLANLSGKQNQPAVAVAGAREGLQVTWGVVIEREGHDKPCVVLDWKVRYYPREVES